jgi:N-acetyltransferase 10
VLRELQLEEPIRYAAGDPIERWLNDLLCLDATVAETIPAGGCPHPADCELYYIHRDTLFSYHKASEAFLHKLMALYVSSHYKNTPNDLQMLSDAPAHHLFCLLGPVDAARNALPDVLCVVQVCLEGDISRQTVANSLARGKAAAGDLIPWTVAQQFQDAEFASLSGARVVRIATHPAYQKMGYGARALELLADYYQGRIPSLAEHDSEDGEGDGRGDGADGAEGGHGAGLHSEVLRARRNLPPLLLKLGERRAERLHWLGVSYGMTEELLKFWKRAGYMPVYLRQTTNELTGEHTCVMLRELDAADLDTKAAPGWTVHYTDDFKRRFVALLGYQFRGFAPSLALQVLEQRGARIGNPTVNNRMSCRGGGVSLYFNNNKGRMLLAAALSPADVDQLLSAHDLKRLESYARNLLDYHVCLDLLPPVARAWFLQRVPVALSALQAALLLGMGLQYKTVDALEAELGLPANQLLALFNRAVRKLSDHFRELMAGHIDQTLAPVRDVAMEMEPRETSLADEMDEAGRQATADLKVCRFYLLDVHDMAWR